ncbi:uncharacterized protein I303_105562 [Kwoniella dejecticola CBS 10117]|uniref:Uncharacterized protein n=1 Tax=Kwoniella dejecticola CBS 10117 TaxID=1296121 RepID=A0A1A6A252_9TREE|nr:uncharacterized protein I303_04995 [Kwoniella dejecticola CBS 10117]OBR84138.1 hypothetical protein I303_04995 [Kwoniella dejecticola CBS 10117]
MNNFLNTSLPQHPHPVLKADEIEKNMFPMGHWRNPKAMRKTTCLSDKVGMADTGVAVHKSILEPNTESTAIHYHLSNTEWIYILSGSAVVQLVNAALPILNPFGPPPPSSDNAPAEKKQKTDKNPESATGAATGGGSEYTIEEVPVSKGDFIGFPGGVGASRFAHGLKAGPEGCEYLVGGDRGGSGVVHYPLSNASDIWERGKDGKFTVASAPTNGDCC